MNASKPVARYEPFGQVLPPASQSSRRRSRILIVPGVDVDRGRSLDLLQLIAVAHEVLVLEEGDRAIDEVTHVTVIPRPPRADRDVGLLAFVDHLGVGERRAALPLLGDSRVAGVGQRAGAEVGAHVEGVEVFPRHLGLRLGQREPVGDERLLHRVVLAHHHRVGAAARQPQQAALVLRVETGRALPHPALLLGGGERVEIDHRLPVGLRLLVLGDRADPAPEPLRVLVVAPEVVEPLRLLLGVGNLVLRVEDREEPFAHRLEVGALGQLTGRFRVVLLHPRERLLAGHLLEPEVGVFDHRGLSTCVG
ncbi:MAG: hypothetical protein QM723_07870 [Myxococcaceae bacterium]